MRARTSRNDAGMDLFPFMAVLICTVGALIMLLVVMVQQARVKASSPGDARVTQPQLDIAAFEKQRQEKLAEHERRKKQAADKQFQVDEFKWKAELLRGSYESAVGQLADQRLALSHLESHSRELLERADAMQAEADLIAAAVKKEQDDDAESKQGLEEIKSAIESAKNELDKTKEELEHLDPKYVLIPYSGPNGTDRRPIYIECLSDRVILQPENVLLIGEDFLAPLTAENPLARALRAKREFLLDNGLMGVDAEPYPLLVVRPGAAATYAAARSAMKAWESEFGYELVESDVVLDYSKPDPRLKQLLEDVVLETRGRRQMMRSMRSSMQPRTRERLRPSASGGFEPVGGGDATFADDEPDRLDDELPFQTDQGDQFASRGRGNGGQGSGRGTGNADKVDSGYDRGATGPRIPNRFDSDVDQDGVGASGDNQLNFAGAHQHGGGGGGAERLDGSVDLGQPSSAGGPQRGSRGDPAAGDSGGPNSTFQSREALATREDRRNPYRGGVSGAGGDADRPGMGGTSADATGAGGKGTTGSGGDGSAAAQSGAASGGSPFGDTPASLAESRGSGWATANMQHDAVGIQRPIYIVCDHESIALLPERGTTQELQVYRHRGSIENVLDAFVGSVQDRLEGWGIAGQGIYWKPVLQIKVKNADVVYQQLLHLLDDSGIEVTREP